MSGAAAIYMRSVPQTWARCRKHGRLNKHHVMTRGGKEFCSRKPERVRNAPPCGERVERVMSL